MVIFLTILAIILSAIFYPIGIIYSAIQFAVKAKFRTWWKKINQYFYVIAVSIDQTGNVVMAELFNHILLRKNSKYKFGNEDETISSVLGKNKYENTLTTIGQFLVFILNSIEQSHVEKAIEKDEK